MIQESLFPEFRKESESSITVEQASKNLNVSTASVRNWIKTGYLEKVGKNRISLTSWNNFKHNVAGKEKLTSRANKSLKDTHDHLELENGLQNLISDESMDGDFLAKTYEESLSNSYKNKEGIYYTPLEIANRFFDYLPKDCSDLSICDPCCGTGNFLIAALQRGFKVKNIFGFDIDSTAVEIAQKRIFDLTGTKTNNIICADFLDVHNNINEVDFDVIFTNPPWGKKLKKAQREKLAFTLNSGKSKDTSAFFFFACLRRLKPKGFLGLMLQDAFFNIASFENARKKALTLDIKGFIDFGKPFKGLLTKAKGIILQNRNVHKNSLIKCESSLEPHERFQRSFARNPKSIFNFSCSGEEAAVIEHLLSMEHINLAGRARYGLGIVTGNNKKFCISQPRYGYMPVYRGSDIKKGELDSPSIFIPSDLSLYQQVAPTDLYQAREKLIYRFISSDLVFYLDTKQRFLLNS
ncbi:N-6 DNA methylase, partial [candidate division KSB1 bacterium]|nr:N-6 DNA methylase [candidate division KSB1 bacterium]